MAYLDELLHPSTEKAIKHDFQESNLAYEEGSVDRSVSFSKPKIISLEHLHYCAQCENIVESVMEYLQYLFVPHNISVQLIMIRKLMSIVKAKTIFKSDRKAENKIITGINVNKLRCPFCSRIFTSIRNWDRHIDREHAKYDSLTKTQRTNYINMLSAMVKYNRELIESTVDPDERVACWECARKFYMEDRLNHYIDKHGAALQLKVKELSKMYSDQRKNAQNPIQNVISMINSKKYCFECWECNEKLECETHLLIHFLHIHTNFRLKQTTDPFRKLRYVLAIAQEQLTMTQKNVISTVVPKRRARRSTKPQLVCTSIYDDVNHTALLELIVKLSLNYLTHRSISIIRRKKAANNSAYNETSLSHRSLYLEITFGPKYCLNVRYFHPESPQNIKLSNPFHNHPIATVNSQRRTDNTYESEPMEVFPCWKCSKIFQTTVDRFSHFIHKHVSLCQSSTNPLSNQASISTVATKKSMRSRQVINIRPRKSQKCWRCLTKHTSNADLIIHFVQQHASFILYSEIDPSSILQNQITTSQKSSGTEKKPTIPKTKAYASLPCSKQFESCRAEHTGPSVSINNNSSSNHLQRQSISVQKSKKPVKHSIKTTATPSSTISASVSSVNMCSNMERVETPTQARSIMKNDQKGLEKPISCWICSTKFKTTRSRLKHFLEEHSSSFLPTINMASRTADKQTRKIGNRANSSSITSNPLANSTSCWECGKKFASFEQHISHFIDMHTGTILFADYDPSSALKNQLIKAQERIQMTDEEQNLTKLTLDCLQRDKKSQSDSTCIDYNNKHANSIQPSAGKLPKSSKSRTIARHGQLTIVEDVDAHSKYGQNLTSNTNSSNHKHNELLSTLLPSLTQRSQDDQEHKKPFASASEYSNRFGTNYLKMDSSIAFINGTSIDLVNTKCPRAAFSTIVYISWGTHRAQISVTPNTTNPCPHKACASKTTKYSFEGLCSHIFEEHDDIQVKLECCDPMVALHTGRIY